MNITFLDFIIAFFVNIIIFIISYIFSIFLYDLLYFIIEFRPIVVLLLFFCFVFFLKIFFLFVLRVFFPLNKCFCYFDRNKFEKIWKFYGFLYMYPLNQIVNTAVVPVNLRSFFHVLLGAKIGKNVMIGGKLLDPSLIEIGDFSMLGEDCLLTAHVVECGYIEVGEIVLGSNVTIGAKAVILPDVCVGDGALVAAGAVVQKGTRISAGEIWGGVPAKKIGMVDSKTM